MALVAGIAGAVIQASSASKAAKAQTAAADKDIAFQKETRDIIRNDLSQYRTGGGVAQSAYDYELGLGAAPMIGGTAPNVEKFSQGGATRPAFGGGTTGGATKFRVNGQVFNTRQEAETYAQANMTGGTAYGGYQASEDHLFRQREGMAGLEASAAARGGLNSGAAMQAALKYNQDYAAQGRDNYLNRLAGRADSGMAAAQMSGAASQQAASGVSNALSAQGNAQSAGYIGVGRAINDGIHDTFGSWNYMRNLPTGTGSGAGSVKPLFGPR